MDLRQTQLLLIRLARCGSMYCSVPYAIRRYLLVDFVRSKASAHRSSFAPLLSCGIIVSLISSFRKPNRVNQMIYPLYTDRLKCRTDWIPAPSQYERCCFSSSALHDRRSEDIGKVRPSSSMILLLLAHAIIAPVLLRWRRITRCSGAIILCLGKILNSPVYLVLCRSAKV